MAVARLVVIADVGNPAATARTTKPRSHDIDDLFVLSDCGQEREQRPKGARILQEPPFAKPIRDAPNKGRMGLGVILEGLTEKPRERLVIHTNPTLSAAIH